MSSISVVGGDSSIRAANIQTCNGKTNRLIVRLYPLEVTSPDEVTASEPLKTKNAIYRIEEIGNQHPTIQ